MHDPVTAVLYRSLSRHPRVSLALRYNRRGVGHSTGRVALWADSDCLDLKAVCAHVAAVQSSSLQSSSTGDVPEADVHLWVVGYSWGAILAAHAACFEEVHGVICISPPAGFLARNVLHSHKHLMMLSLPNSAHKPKLVVTGTDDGIASVTSVRWLVNAVNKQLDRLQSDPGSDIGQQGSCSASVELVQLEECLGATHFWTERAHVKVLVNHVMQVL
ncbi:hypothetical protein WJX73_004900 [Symbiochloris irregularis]|uniref:AB hydrolase-1 domain-containing protein n=1 Tax=Symbiochloris irregularis TaxID=706552 RepID=A0AAW1NQT3_9CHLO